MTATDELRRLLDERGVEWVAIGTDTCWTGADGYPMRAWETTNGTHMRVADLTPEQAIEATLGSDLKAENEKLREQIETLVMYVEADGTRYWVDDDGNQHFDFGAI